MIVTTGINNSGKVVSLIADDKT